MNFAAANAGITGGITFYNMEENMGIAMAEEETRMKKIVSLALVALLLLGVSAPALATDNPAWNDLLNKTAASIEQLTADYGELTVVGTAAIAVEPDMATLTLGVMFEDPSTAVAQDKVNEVIAKLVETLKAQGIPENKIATNNYYVSPTYDYGTDPAVLRGYQVSEMLNVTVEDFSLISKVIDTSVAIGVNQVQSITFDTSKRAEIYRQALANAIAAAQQKAVVMVQAAGKQLVDLRSLAEAEQGQSLYLNAYDTRATGMKAESQILGGEINVTAQVTLVYDIR